MNVKTNGLTTTVLCFTVMILASSCLLLFLFQPVVQPQPAFSLQHQDNATATQVEIVNGSSNPDNGQFFVPSQIQISNGDTVTWTNNDIAIHTVTQDSPSDNSTSLGQQQQQFDSGLMPVGSTFKHTFNDAGLVDYYCTIHPWMTGKVTIR